MNKKEVEKIRKILPRHRQKLLEKKNVVAVGIGFKFKDGKITDQIAIICNVKKKEDKSKISSKDIIPEILDGVETDVLEVGDIVAQQDPKSRLRPAPGGVSVGHFAITAGTLGMWVKKDGIYYILSNNHVLANCNKGSKGDHVIQPGAYDSGVNSSDKIAELSEFVEIDWVDSNLVDAALAKVVSSSPTEEPSNCPVAGFIAGGANTLASAIGAKTRLRAVLYQKNVEDFVLDEVLNIGKISETDDAELGMEVKKMGRTTGLTHGQIIQVDASVTVSYGDKSAYFVDQLIAGNISSGGDSGSVVVTEEGNKLVGLLFAGSNVVTIINRIQNVFSALNISF